MSSATLKKIIPCKKNQLVEMVLDIEKYPEFVPWCIEGKIFDKNESSDLITFNGDCLLYTSPSPRDTRRSRMPSSA